MFFFLLKIYKHNIKINNWEAFRLTETLSRELLFKPLRSIYDDDDNKASSKMIYIFTIFTYDWGDDPIPDRPDWGLDFRPGRTTGN